MKKNQNCADGCQNRLGRVGGQAVIEGVMMKAGEKMTTTCRKEDGSLIVNSGEFVSVRKKHKILNIPILRGIINFIEMMKLSLKTMNDSADALGIEEEDGKVEKWLKKHLGLSLTEAIVIIGMVLGVALSLFLFMFLPKLASDGVAWLLNRFWSVEIGVFSAVVEGICKVIIFITYLWLISLMPDIKRTFMYHGAEHKTIACFEAGAELTPENAKNYTRFHPRCGTSFMFFMILLGIVVGLFVNYLFPGLHRMAYMGIRLLLLPLVVGVGYEFIMFAGKHDNVITRFFSAPGLWVQRITTREPTPDMLEVAICSTKCVLRDEFPEFMEFYQNQGWIKREEATDGEACASAEEAPENEGDLAQASGEEISSAEASE